MKEFETMFKIENAEMLVRAIRNIVQDNILGGVFMTRPYSDLIDGYWDSNLEFLWEGEFTKGEGDPSISTFISIN